jgi:hypothetical protein
MKTFGVYKKNYITTVIERDVMHSGYNRTPLMLAAGEGHNEAIINLLEKSLDPAAELNKSDDFGKFRSNLFYVPA